MIREFEKPVLEVVQYGTEDIITGSGPEGSNCYSETGSFSSLSSCSETITDTQAKFEGFQS